jgi:ribosome-associated translation inhibitor RaiA
MSETMEQGSETVPVEVTGIGSPQERRYAVEKVRSLATYAHRPVRRAHVTIATTNDPAPGRRVRIAANLDVDGRVVHAEAVGGDVRACVDALRQRLYTKLSRRRGFWGGRKTRKTAHSSVGMSKHE